MKLLAPRRWRRVKRGIREMMPVPLWRSLRRLKGSARSVLLHQRSHNWLLRHHPADLSDVGLLSGLIERFRKEEIAQAYAHDPWLGNYFVNIWEYTRGEAVLASYPWNVTVPIADVCNVRCTFCTSWLEGTRELALEELSKFADVLRFARTFGTAGHGEPLADPGPLPMLVRLSCLHHE